MRSTGRRRPAVALAAAVLALAFASCTSGGSPLVRDRRGQRIEVLAVWSGAEQQRFERVVDAFERATGVTVAYASAGHGVPAELDARAAAGQLPDVAFLPQPGLLRHLAADGRLTPLDPALAAEVRRNYGPMWTALGSYGSHVYGVWFKAANKSLLWYNVAVFERAGIVPPHDLDGLLRVAGSLSASGVPAFSVGGADGWVLTDWFENLYLRTAGPERYDLLADHRIPWTDPSVTQTLALLGQVLDPSALAGGTPGALATGFEASVVNAFARPPGAAMVFEGDFVAGTITAGTGARLGVDADVFPFPAVGDSGPSVVAGGDAAVLLRSSPAGAAFVRYLASPEAAAIWAGQGGFVSPNLNLDLAVYPDALSRSMARNLLDAGAALRFDLSDLQPAAFGGTAGHGLRGGLQDFLRERDVDATARRLEDDAMAAYGR